MIELGELEGRWQEVGGREVKGVAVSIEDQDAARATQAQFPHLVVVSDEGQKLTEAVSVIHHNTGPDRGDAATPSTLLIDGGGVVRWAYRPVRVLTRLKPNALLAAID